MDEQLEQGQERALRRLREIERQLPSLLNALIAAPSFRRGRRPAVPKMPGVYLFTEDGVHRYIGRTRNANRRLGEHIQTSSPQNSAPFAFKMAKAEATREGVEFTGTRDEIAATPEFTPFFQAAKERIRAMDFRVIKVADPALSTIFEVYAAVVLETEGDFNLFETH